MKRTFESMPRDIQELTNMVAFGTRVDDATGFSKPTTSVMNRVFGSVHDIMYTALPLFEADTYQLFPSPPPDTRTVELLFPDKTLQSSVPLLENGTVRCKRQPLRARVKSTARTLAFMKLCGQPAVAHLHSQITAAVEASTQMRSRWTGVAYDGFSGMLSVANDSSKHCGNVLVIRKRLYASHAALPMSRNLMVQAVTASAPHCDACVSAACAIRDHEQSVFGLAKEFIDTWKGVCKTFFVSCDMTPAVAPTTFCPKGEEAVAQAVYAQCMSAGQAKKVSPVTHLDFSPGAGFEHNLAVALQVCGCTLRGTRIRNILHGHSGTVIGHWNDAAVTAGVCDALHDSTLARLVSILPDVNLHAVLAVACDVAALSAHVNVFACEIQRLLRSCCTDVNVDMSVLSTDAFSYLTSCVAAVQDAGCTLAQTVLKLKDAVDDASQLQFAWNRCAAIVKDVSVHRHRDADRKDQHPCSWCPEGNVEVMAYSSEGDRSLRSSSTRHAEYAQDASTGTIYCVNRQCLERRCQRPPPEAGDLLVFARTVVAAGHARDPMQDRLHGSGCAVCGKTSGFTVSADGRGVRCGSCQTLVHSAASVVEWHSDPRCPDPGAGITTAVDTATVTCQGCGLVLSDYMCLDEGADERNYADEDDDPRHHGVRSSPFLSTGSDVTYISVPKGDSCDSVALRKVARVHSRMNTYVFTDDCMRLTSWVKKDDHVKKFQRMAEEALEMREVCVSRAALATALQTFTDIRWHTEKVTSARFIMFTLMCRAMLDTERAVPQHEMRVCRVCSADIPVRFIHKHLMTCGKQAAVPALKKKKKRCREPEYLEM
jgi:hypothetical protein